MSLLVGLILTALNGPVGTESRGFVSFSNLDTIPLNLFKITFNKVTLTEIYLPFSDIFEGKSTDGAARNGIVRSGKNAIY
jgi:hypothetical protein